MSYNIKERFTIDKGCSYLQVAGAQKTGVRNMAMWKTKAVCNLTFPEKPPFLMPVLIWLRPTSSNNQLEIWTQACSYIMSYLLQQKHLRIDMQYPVP
jgi:hypothetical protein